MSLNPTNGNLAAGGSLPHLRGVGQDLNIGWRYNGINDTRPSLSTGLYENALQPWTDGSFTYVSPDGGCYYFTKSGSNWSTPAGINATLTSPVAGTMKLRLNLMDPWIPLLAPYRDSIHERKLEAGPGRAPAISDS